MEYVVISIGPSGSGNFTVRVPEIMRQAISDSGKTVNNFYKAALEDWLKRRGYVADLNGGLKSHQDLVNSTAAVLKSMNAGRHYKDKLTRSDLVRMVLSSYIMTEAVDTEEEKESWFKRVIGFFKKSNEEN